jgi:alcohol dehydrogenase
MPELGDDDAPARVDVCRLFRTDAPYVAELASGFTFVPGHETVGTIA